DGQGNLPRQERPFDFFDEEALAGRPERRGRRDPIPRGLDGDDHEVQFRVVFLEAREDLAGLGKGEGASAGADLDGRPLHLGNLGILRELNLHKLSTGVIWEWDALYQNGRTCQGGVPFDRFATY